jgi:hypothetical protein
MPFTPAHTAAVLPLVNRKFFSATALIAGSMTPDFEYFFRLGVKSLYGHTIAGLFYFNIPVAFLLCLAYHYIVKPNLIRNIPVYLQIRFQDTVQTDFMAVVKTRPWAVILSAFLGAGSHVLWDSFTHNGGYFAQTLPVYQGTFIPLFGIRYPLFFFLQHLSTVIGLILLAVFIIRKKPSREAVLFEPRLEYWLTIAGVALILTTIRFIVHPSDLNFGNFVVTCTSGIFLGFIVGGLLRLNNNQLQL